MSKDITKKLSEEEVKALQDVIRIFKDSGILEKEDLGSYKKEPTVSSTKTTRTTKVVIEGNNSANVTMIHTGTGDNIGGKVIINGRELPKHYYDLNTYFSGKGGKDND